MTSLQSTDCQLSLADWLAQQDRRARGETFSEVLDKARLGKQALAVARVMQDQDWHTLQEINDHVPGLQTSISARIRELRNFLHETARGTIDRRPHPTMPRGVFQYRMTLK